MYPGFHILLLFSLAACILAAAKGRYVLTLVFVCVTGLVLHYGIIPRPAFTP